jgi:hypothetical protein
VPKAGHVCLTIEPAWIKTAEERRRWRRAFSVGLMDKLGFSSRFIADAFGIDDGKVRSIVRSQTVALIRYPNVSVQ